MKRMKKLMAFLLTMVMIMALGMTAFAQEVDSGKGGSATITINNAAKGETYKVYKLFDATVTGTEGGSIAYTGEIPTTLSNYFSKDTATGAITATDAAKSGDSMSDGLKTALTTWANSQPAATATAVADGSTLVFKGLKYGYYVVTTTQGNAAITVDSTNPNATIVDKNSTTPVNNLKKDADHTDVNINDTVTYTVSFATANYTGSGTNAKQITSYLIEDTLPDFLTDVTVTSITVTEGTGDTAKTTTLTTQQFSEKKITISWTDGNGKNLYANGATLTIVYTATVADTANIAGSGNTNKVTVTPYCGTNPDTSKGEATETISTYAIALKKTDDKGNPLAGAEFTLPFYVKTTTDANGAYIYAGESNGEGLTNTVTTPVSGEITIKGVKSGTYSITESKAPDGYNKLTEAVSVTAQKLTTTTTNKTFYIDADGNKTDEKTNVTVTYENTNLAADAVLVINKTGAELPSTGGIGTTIFYVIGAICVLGAGVLLVTRRRMSSN